MDSALSQSCFGSYRLASHLKQVLDEVFGEFENQIAWKRSAIATGVSKQFRNSYDILLFYSKTGLHKFNVQYKEYTESSKKHYSKSDNIGQFRTVPLMASGRTNGISGQPWKGVSVANRGKNGMHWLKNPIELERLDSEGLIYWNKQGVPELKYYLTEAKGVYVSDFWDDIPPINSMAKESEGFPTQKPETLLERIISSSSDKNDIIADFFVGSGTTLAVAEKMGRKWIGADLGKFAIHTTRKRLIGVQRELKKQGEDYRAFEILNLGKYERQHYVGVNANLLDEQQRQQLAEKERKFVKLILTAYRAEEIKGFSRFEGKRNNRLVAVGPIDLPVGREFVQATLEEAIKKGVTKIDILAFEFEMGLFPRIQEEAKDKGVDLALKYIPQEVFDKRAVEKNQIVFHDVAYIEVKPHIKGKTVAVELTDFSVFYNQDTIANVESELKNGSSKIMVENGQIIKVSKDKNGITKRETLTKKWTDWIDYWAVDFNFEDKKEIIRVKKDDGSTQEVWTGDYIFENEWQSFRTKKDRSLELDSIYHEVNKGRRKIAIKVVDIFGNDTTKIIEVNL